MLHTIKSEWLAFSFTYLASSHLCICYFNASCHKFHLYYVMSKFDSPFKFLLTSYRPSTLSYSFQFIPYSLPKAVISTVRAIGERWIILGIGLIQVHAIALTFLMNWGHAKYSSKSNRDCDKLHFSRCLHLPSYMFFYNMIKPFYHQEMSSISPSLGSRKVLDELC